VLFVAHGAPPILDDARWQRELSTWAASLPRPRALLVVSAHWESRPLTLSATQPVPLVYDFYGFPRRYYELTYAAPPAVALASRLEALLGEAKQPVQRSDRGLDHGAWVPLRLMYPEADVPVLQLSLPSLEPTELFDLGQHLAPLRDEGVLLVTSGFITHNLGAVDWSELGAVPSWASEFDEWVAQCLAQWDVDALLDYRRRAPGVTRALPTVEHFVPLLLALGAATSGVPPRFPLSGFWLGSLSRRSVEFA